MFEYKDLPLGRKVELPRNYDKRQLAAIPRKLGRSAIDIKGALPFYGYDLWNAYEVSWLDNKGKPHVALMQLIINCNSELLVESKSVKLYLNSFNNTKFESQKQVEKLIVKDLNEILKTKVIATFSNINSKVLTALPPGECIDEQEISIPEYDEVDSSVLAFADLGTEEVIETLHSNLLKTNCLITNQPDWATVIITYKGRIICREKLLNYLVSFRNHSGFHEQCVERIFVDIMERCKPSQLTVYARFTRRGGIDISPIRSTQDIITPSNVRFIRQ